VSDDRGLFTRIGDDQRAARSGKLGRLRQAAEVEDFRQSLELAPLLQQYRRAALHDEQTSEPVVDDLPQLIEEVGEQWL
jgi:hypothetical protein